MSPEYDYYNEETGQYMTIAAPLHADKPATIEYQGKIYRRVFGAPKVIYGCMGFYTTDNADSIEKWRRENMKGL